MRETIKIGDRDIEMVANGATPFIFKRVFRKDFLAETQKEDMDVYAELAFIMSQQAEKPMTELLNSLKIEDFYAWIEGFEAMDIVTMAPDIFAIYQGQTKSSSASKKKK